MEFLEARGVRFEESLEEFLCGKGMTFRGVNFWRAPDDHLEVRVHPNWRINRDEKQESLGEMEFASGVAAEIMAASPRFAVEIGNLPWRQVKLDASGKEVICLYCPEESKVLWSAWMA